MVTGRFREAALAERRLSLPEGAVFGRGVVSLTGEMVARLGARGAFVVTDPGLAACGIAGTVQAVLEGAGVPVAVFDAVSPNPAIADIEAGSAALSGFGLRGTVVVGVGGGSSMDAAKAISLHAANGGDVLDLDYRTGPKRPGLPLVVLPTTSGTGSETNSFGVITAPGNGGKFYVGHASVRPKAAVLDPDLTAGLPPLATAATGVDALTHALESLVSRNANPYADGLALQAVRMVWDWLPTAVEDGAHAEARSQMLLAAHLAGLAFSSGTGLGLCHAIAHPLGARLGCPHGAALAAVLPQVMEFNLPASSARLALVARSLGLAAPDETEGSAARAFVAAVRRLMDGVMGGCTLASLGATGEMLPDLARAAMDDGVISNTPRMPSASEVEAILVSSL